MLESATSPDPNLTRSAIAFLRGLRQIRQLSPESVPPDALQDILEVARWTGSARNLQPWDLVVVEDRQTLQALATIEGSHAAPAGQRRRISSSGSSTSWLRS